MARNGRPRKKLSQPGKPRQRKDTGSDRLVKLRSWLAGKGDPAKTTCPIDVLYSQNVIDDHQHRAARQYARDYWRVYGQPSISAAAYEFRDRSTGPAELDEVDKEGADPDQEAWDRLTTMQRHFERLLPGLMDYTGSLRDLIVYEVTPRWMTANPPRERDEMAGRVFMQALKHLVKMDA